MEQKTIARYIDYQKQIFLDRKGEPAEGKYTFNGTAFKFKNGLLDGQGEPAIECNDSHTEFWKAGLLHNPDGPAVISDNNAVTEYCIYGKKMTYEEFRQLE